MYPSCKGALMLKMFLFIVTDRYLDSKLTSSRAQIFSLDKNHMSISDTLSC